MSIDEIRAKIKSSIWQATAQSGVNLSALPEDQQNRLIETITDKVMLIMNDLLEDAGAGFTPQVDLDVEEQILWKGRPFLSLVEHYVLTNERIKVTTGLLGKSLENFELIRVQDIDVKQSAGERLMGIGDINIRGADRSNPELVLRNVRDPQGVYEILRKAWLDARRKYGLIFREEM